MFSYKTTARKGMGMMPMRQIADRAANRFTNSTPNGPPIPVRTPNPAPATSAPPAANKKPAKRAARGSKKQTKKWKLKTQEEYQEPEEQDGEPSNDDLNLSSQDGEESVIKVEMAGEDKSKIKVDKKPKMVNEIKVESVAEIKDDPVKIKVHEKLTEVRDKMRTIFGSDYFFSTMFGDYDLDEIVTSWTS